MKNRNSIKFKTVLSSLKKGERPCYRAVVMHNGTVDRDEIAKAAAERAGMDVAVMRYAVELFCSQEPDLRDEIHEAFDRVGECVKKLDWVIPYMESLKARGYSLYYLSNMSEHVINSNKEAFAFTDHMDGGVFSCDVRQIKPDQDIYKTLFTKYDLVPEECVFIDDHSENTDVAEELGMKGLVFVSREQMQADLDSLLGA